MCCEPLAWINAWTSSSFVCDLASLFCKNTFGSVSTLISPYNQTIQWAKPKLETELARGRQDGSRHRNTQDTAPSSSPQAP